MNDSLAVKYEITKKDVLYVKLKNNCPEIFRKLGVKKIFSFIRGNYNDDRIERFECEKYFGFSVEKYSYGYNQFCYPWVNLESIGSFCSIAKNVSITGWNHPYTYITTSPIAYHPTRGFVNKEELEQSFYDKNKKVVIGNDVWIGDNVTILPSVKIGNGSVIGAGAVVTKDVPDYAIVAGVPAKVVKYRFNDKEIEILNQIKWWEWSEKVLKENIDLFRNPIEFFRKSRLNEF
jgi:virginiamycin A acetyltransferase